MAATDDMNTGAPGILFLSVGYVFNYISHLNMQRSDVTFWLGTVATSLAIIYYLVQIKKIRKTNKHKRQ